MANVGFDFVTIDAQHSAVDLADAQPIHQAIRSGNPNTEAFVRLHGVDYAVTKRYFYAWGNRHYRSVDSERRGSATVDSSLEIPADGQERRWLLPR